MAPVRRTEPPLRSLGASLKSPVDSFARAAAAIVCLALVGAGCTIEPPAPPSTSTSHEQVVHLTAASPVAVRHLTFEISPPKRGLNASLAIEATRVTGDKSEFPDGVTISVVADDLRLRSETSGVTVGSLPGSTILLTDYCAEGCLGGATIVVRGAAHARLAEDIRLKADLSASGTSSNQDPLGTTLTITADGDPTFDGMPGTIVATVERTVVVSQASPDGHLSVSLHVDANALMRPLDYPLVGTFRLLAVEQGTNGELLTSYYLPLGRMTVNGRPVGMSTTHGLVDLDWLGLCAPDRDCDVTIEVDLTFARLSDLAEVGAAVDNRTLSAPPSSFELRLSLEASLEAFDHRPLPAGSVTLTAQ